MIATRKALLQKLAVRDAAPAAGLGGDRYSDGLAPATAKLPRGYRQGRRRRGCRSQAERPRSRGRGTEKLGDDRPASFPLPPRTSSVHRLEEIQFPSEELVMELCKPLHVRTAERVPYGLKLSGNAALDGFRERR